MIAVKVTSKKGSTATVLAGVAWAAAQADLKRSAKDKKHKGSLMNMSIATRKRRAFRSKHVLCTRLMWLLLRV